MSTLGWLPKKYPRVLIHLKGVVVATLWLQRLCIYDTNSGDMK